MKQIIFLMMCMNILCTSCCTIFSSTKQTVTFMAPEGTDIYDAANNIKIAEVKQDGLASARIKKRREDKTFIARKEGYKPVPFQLETSFNANSLWNLLFWPGFVVDFGTGKMFRWDTTLINIELEKKEEQPSTDNNL